MESISYSRKNRSKSLLVDDDVKYIYKNDVSKYLNNIKLQNIIDKKRKEFFKVIENDLNDLFDDLNEEINENKIINKNFVENIDFNNKNNKDSLPEKIFINRDSVLTNLLEISHIRTVYHMFVAVLIIFLINTMITDWVTKGGMFHIYHFEWILWAFGKFGDVIIIWLGMKVVSILMYSIFLIWLNLRHLYKSTSFVDRIFLFLYIIFIPIFIIIPLKFILNHDLPPCSSAIVVLENIRLMMKMHAFIRENVAKTIYNPNINTVNFSKYLYFLFAPTLIYRDEYPKNPTIRWSYVVSNFAQVWFCIVYMYFIFSRFCIYHFQNFNSTHVTIEQLVISIFGCMLPGTLVLLICFYCLLHSWFNAFAEMLQFGDRLFYKEWWNSTTFSNYYRTWNVVVHDWLYTYIYRDILLLSKCKNRAVAMTCVFFISAVFHEYALSVIFRFFYPVLFVMFGGAGFGMMFLKGRSRIWNIGFWVALFIGTGIIMCLYSMEWFARRNCPLYFNYAIDLIVPRSWFCKA